MQPFGGNVGIGTDAPSTLGGGAKLTVNQGADGNIVFARGGSTRQVQLGTTSTTGYINSDNASGGLAFHMNGSEKARIDSSGNLLVGETNNFIATSTSATGLALTQDGRFTLSRSAGTPMNVGKIGADGELIDFWKTGAHVGSIKVANGNLIIGTNGTNKSGIYFGDNAYFPVKNGSITASPINFGSPNYRFQDLYLSGGVDFGGAVNSGGVVSSSNKLDDYEEGTWTVNIIKGGSALPVNTRYGYYTKVGNLIYIQFYWFHDGGLSSQTNNSTQYKVIGMPYALKNLTGAAYAGIGSTYLTVNNTNYADNYYHKWQVNATDSLSLTGHAETTQHSSGVLELSGAGVFRTT